MEMRILDLTLKDLRQLVLDWKAAVFLVAMPVIFNLMFGYVFGGIGAPEDPRLPVGFLDRDGGSALSTGLYDLLADSSAIRPVEVDVDADIADLDRQVRDEDLAAVVIVPAGYGERVMAGEPVPLESILVADSAAGQTAQGELQAAVNRLVGAVQAAQLSADLYEQQAGFADDTARRSYFNGALNRALAAWENPPLRVVVSSTGGAEEEKTVETVGNAFAHSSPSMIIQFAIAGLMGAGEILVLERKTRVLQRLLTTAMSRWQIILGHFLAMLVMILAQVVLLVVFAQVALQVNYFQAPLGLLALAVALALFIASLGLLIGTLARSNEHVIIFTLILMFVLSGLGGAWIPLEFTSSTFQTVGHLMPTAWAIDGLENIVVRGLGNSSALLPAGVLLAWAVVIFALAVWRFRTE
jgi:ABC-2 type transport system permease protein